MDTRWKSMTVTRADEDQRKHRESAKGEKDMKGRGGEEQDIMGIRLIREGGME